MLILGSLDICFGINMVNKFVPKSEDLRVHPITSLSILADANLERRKQTNKQTRGFILIYKYRGLSTNDG